MKAKIEWVGGASFEGTAGSGHTVTMDGPPEAGGENRGCRPMELLLLGLGGCTAFDVVSILRKARQPVTGCEVDVTAERAETPPKVFTRIHLHYRVRGDGLSAKHVARAVSLSKEKYCSASIMLAETAELTHEVSIEEAKAGGGAG
ncbi:MAG: OsmC family protein [Gammaproteobacteria bacterium]|nr:OsmC family protein [Gammaproteobacteria bacterium]